eukprot:gene13109-35776_t
MLYATEGVYAWLYCRHLAPGALVDLLSSSPVSLHHRDMAVEYATKWER